MSRSYYSFVDQLFDHSAARMADSSFLQYENLLSPTYLLEDNGEYRLEIAVPGMARDDVKVDLQGNQLKVEGRRRSQHNRWAFKRSFVLPENADFNKIKAKCEHGLLVITVPMTSVSKGRLIPVSGKDTINADNGTITPWQKWKQKIKARLDHHNNQ
jgi:HSP20 family protein